MHNTKNTNKIIITDYFLIRIFNRNMITTTITRTANLSKQLDPLGLSHSKLQNLYALFKNNLVEQSQYLSIEKFGYILAKFVEYQPVELTNMLTKLLNTDIISWDQFLSILHKDGNIRQRILDQIINPKVQLQQEVTTDPTTKELNKLVKNKSIELRKFEIWETQTHQFYIALVQNQIMIIDPVDGKPTAILDYYTLPLDLMKMQKRVTGNSSVARPHPPLMPREITDLAVGILTHNLKKSINMMDKNKEQNSHEKKRNITESSNIGVQKRRRRITYFEKPKRNQFIIKKSDISTIFNLFTELSIQKSITLSKMYSESQRKDVISIDKQIYQKQLKSFRQPHPSKLIKKNFDIQNSIQKMKKQKKKLSYNPRRYSLLDDPTPPVYIYQKSKEVRNKITAMENNITKNKLYINWYSLNQQYLVVALVTKELRFFKIKKSFFNKIATQLIYTKNCKYSPVYVRLYRSSLSLQQNLVVGCEEQNKLVLRVYQYIEDKPLYEIYTDSINFFPIFQEVQGKQQALFNQIGFLNLYELNSLEGNFIKIRHRTQLINPKTDKKMPISTVRFHKETLTLFVGCLDGYIYNMVYDSLQLRNFKKITNGSILCSEIYNDTLLVVYSSDNRCRILKLRNLQVGNCIDLNDLQYSKFRYILKSQDSFYLYGPAICKLKLQTNEEVKKQEFYYKNLNHQQRKMLTTVFQTETQQKSLNNNNNNNIIQKQSLSWVKYCNYKLRIILCFTSSLIKIISADNLDQQVSFLCNFEPQTIVLAQLSKNGVIIMLANEDYQIQIFNVYSQQFLLKLTFNFFSNILLMPNQNKFLLGINTSKGQSHLIPVDSEKHSKQILKNHSCEITASWYISDQFITGDQRGTLCIYAKNNYKYYHILPLNTNNKPISSIHTLNEGSNMAIVNASNYFFYQISIFQATILKTYIIQENPGLQLCDYYFPYDILYQDHYKKSLKIQNIRSKEIYESHQNYSISAEKNILFADKIITINKKGEISVCKRKKHKKSSNILD